MSILALFLWVVFYVNMWVSFASVEPTMNPTSQPSIQPSSKPSPRPSSSRPTYIPSSQPSLQPVGSPSAQPVGLPTSQPKSYPSSQPIGFPSSRPSSSPTSEPTCQPSQQPFAKPSIKPSNQPISRPSQQPAGKPSLVPSSQPSQQPFAKPSIKPSNQPISRPSQQPAGKPSLVPSSQPSALPSKQPMGLPTNFPSAQPYSLPSKQPWSVPSVQPSNQPKSYPSSQPSSQPSIQPSSQPSNPSGQPSAEPSSDPSSQPSCQPSIHPSTQPSTQPSVHPSMQPFSLPSCQPSGQPSIEPSTQPTDQPVGRPSMQPSREPSVNPTIQPSIQPSGNPTRQPSSQPSRVPTMQPTSQPSRQPTSQPTCLPSRQPSNQPTRQPSNQPSGSPTRQPSNQPSRQPTRQPSKQPLCHPSAQPSAGPTSDPSSQPSLQPFSEPSSQPSRQPSMEPSSEPSMQPTVRPSFQPSNQPSRQPTLQPSRQPYSAPSGQPSRQPSRQPSCQPTRRPSRQPSRVPTQQPSGQPSYTPSISPSGIPSLQPTDVPSSMPSVQPSSQPTDEPSMQPTIQPSGCPSSPPSRQPSIQPSSQPTRQPSQQPTRQPTNQPSRQPATLPTSLPSIQPTVQPTNQPMSLPSCQPSIQPSRFPSGQPSTMPTLCPTNTPSDIPSRIPSGQPSSKPSVQPSAQPSRDPSAQPTRQPSRAPTRQPSTQPSRNPTRQPSSQPSRHPTNQPSTQPTRHPSAQPSSQPIIIPVSAPSRQPSSQPSVNPSRQPSSQPSRSPTRQPSRQPTVQPVSRPSCQPMGQPTSPPSMQPSVIPSLLPTSQPSRGPSGKPSINPSRIPSQQPTSLPSIQPAIVPSQQPSSQPTGQPSRQPSCLPTNQPTGSPTTQPSTHPTVEPSSQPSFQPSKCPSSQPSTLPSGQPSITPSTQPTIQPSRQPSSQPSRIPSRQPSSQPSRQPSSQPSVVPSRQPSMQPSIQPSTQPSIQPSRQPSRQPTLQPSSYPSSQPSTQPTEQPSNQPSVEPSRQPSSQPTSLPSQQPSTQPSIQPSRQPTRQPSSQPTRQPTIQPTCQPTRQPSSQPTIQPTSQPSMQPSRQPSSQPSVGPSRQPSSQPSRSPTSQPSMVPSQQPSRQPSNQPTSQPSSFPSADPSSQPSVAPTIYPTNQPSSRPSNQPTSLPSQQPSSQPSLQPSILPSSQPSMQPSIQPSSQPSVSPSRQPSSQPSRNPTSQPSVNPSRQPSRQPSMQPTNQPSTDPSEQPSSQPSCRPSSQPTIQPSSQPSTVPSSQPSIQPSIQPSNQPSTQPSLQPSVVPSNQPSSHPTTQPSGQPTNEPSISPTTQPSGSPSLQPSPQPTSIPSMQPTSMPSMQPTRQPTRVPSCQPTRRPTIQPSVQPTRQPSSQPSRQPTQQPTGQPTRNPTMQPSSQPSSQPTGQPTTDPSTQPSFQPTDMPSKQPTIQPSMVPSTQPSVSPSSDPSTQPSRKPSRQPSMQPSMQPSNQPSSSPSKQPSSSPSTQPTRQPSTQPSVQPSMQPSMQPSRNPTMQPSNSPSRQPSTQPTRQPSSQPSVTPTQQPSSKPSSQPSCTPTNQPSSQPSTDPSMQPTCLPSSWPSSQPSRIPTCQPTRVPSVQPSSNPSQQPSMQPTRCPTTQPSRIPTRQPSGQPSRVPTAQPSRQPSRRPSQQPSSNPTLQPSSQPTRQPSSQPSCQPSSTPTRQPSEMPSNAPSNQPTRKPSLQPSASPSRQPTSQPSRMPSLQPSTSPSSHPSNQPTAIPSSQPVSEPSLQPSGAPSRQPHILPSSTPSRTPSEKPTCQPSILPSSQPSYQPSLQPNVGPSSLPTRQPSNQPSHQPSRMPTSQPSRQPSKQPVGKPSRAPSNQPTSYPSNQPSCQPSSLPTSQPALVPSGQPSCQPSSLPSEQPTISPTNKPSAQPSVYPSNQPSSSPSRFPTRQPFSCPTRQPSSRPSMVPTQQPRGIPSMQPTSQPVLIPTSDPTASPSVQPSQQPFMKPSCQPSGQPSIQPSSFPTNPTSQPTEIPSSQPSLQPSTQPSSNPSEQPSFQPSIQPSNMPSSQPSVQPTRLPSLQPNARPSALPSIQPSQNPTCKPSHQPTAIPSRQPSNQPSIQPSTQPSNHPSLQPFGDPTSIPTTSVPTSRPTDGPSKHPTTSKPTKSGDTSRPTNLPSSSPTYDSNYDINPVYQRYRQVLDSISGISNTFTSSMFHFKGSTVFGSCNDWRTFTSTSLQLPRDDLYFYKITSRFEYFDFETKTLKYQNSSCTSLAAVDSIISSLSTGVSVVVKCNGVDWRVKTCRSDRILCLNCKESCVETVTCPGKSLSMDPCSNCEVYTAASAIVHVAYGLKILYPQFLGPFNISTSRTSAIINVNVTKAGRVICGAFDPSFLVASTGDIANAMLRSSSNILTSGISKVVFNGLSPDSRYSVYCYAQDFLAHVMPIAESIQSRADIATTCCRRLEFKSSTDYVTEFITGDTRQVTPFIVRLDSVPRGAQIVRIRLRQITCLGPGSNIMGSSATAFPSVFRFYSNSSSLEASFVVRGSQGCFTMGVYGNGTDRYDHINHYLVIRSRNLPPDPPKIVNALYSNDGLKILVNFNANTDRSITVAPFVMSTFNCSLVVVFSGSDLLQCQWTTLRQISASLIGSTVIPAVGENIYLRGKSLMAECIPNVDCTRRSYTPFTFTNISRPAIPLIPTVSLLIPKAIGACDSISIDASLSIGHGGRRWKSITWMVEVSGGFPQNATTVADYLNVLFSNTLDDVIEIPNSYLVIGVTYSILLKVINFLDMDGASSASVTVKSDTIIPRVVIGSPTSTLYRWNTISLMATASIPNCGGAASKFGLIYKWKVFEGVTYLPEFQSVSLDARIFKLPAYSLQASSSYFVQVVVVVDTGSNINPPTSVASIMIQIGQSGLYTSIAGGATQTISASQDITLDASNSKDLDYPTISLNYTWTCSEFSPTFGAPCSYFVPSTSSVLLISAQSLPPNKVYTIIVNAMNYRGISSSSHCRLTVVSPALPRVAISDIGGKVNPSAKIVLTGNIFASLGVFASWTSTSFKDLKNSSIITTPLTQTFGSGTIIYQLSIIPGSLTPGLSYTFSLSSYYPSETVSRNPLSASSTIIIDVNDAPKGGILIINPGTGIALNTSFFFQTKDWLDDPNDYPLSNVMFCTPVDPDSRVTVKSLSTISSARAFLSQGLVARQYIIDCAVEVYDIYSSFSVAAQIARIYPIPSITAAAGAVSEKLEEAFTLKNPSAVYQVISAVVTSLNTVECKLASNCRSINRRECSQTPNTCGVCLSSDFVGPSGDSNVACLSKDAASKAKKTGEKCTVNKDCMSNLCNAESVCLEVQKTCWNGCSGRGQCSFIDKDGELVEECSIFDSSCEGVCTCYDNYYGRDCMLSKVQLETTLKMREELCHSIRSTLSMQDASADVVTSRALTISSILMDLSQVTEKALTDCSASLVATVIANPELAGTEATSKAVVGALSNVLELGQSIPIELFNDIANAITYLSLGCQASLAIGEPPVEIASPNMRLNTVLSSKEKLGELGLSIPQTAYEKISGIAATRANVDTSGIVDSTNPLGITCIQYPNNPKGSKANSTSVSIESVQYAGGGSPGGNFLNGLFRHRRSLDANVNSTQRSLFAVNFLEYKLELVNTDPIDYMDFQPSNHVIKCRNRLSDKATEANITCPSKEVFKFNCPARINGDFNVTCPSFKMEPLCTTWDGNGFAVDPNCHVESYTSIKTVCICRTPLSSGGSLNSFSFHDRGRNIRSLALAVRAEDASSRSANEYSTKVVSRTTYLVNIYAAAPTLEAVKANTIILSFLASVIGILIVGFLIFSGMDYLRSKKSNHKRVINDGQMDFDGVEGASTSIRSAKVFFDSLLPIEFEIAKWYILYYRRLVFDHPIMSFLVSLGRQNSDDRYSRRVAYWIIAVGDLLHYLFIATIVCSFLFSDGGECEAITTKDDCTATNAFVLASLGSSACVWKDDPSNFCMFNVPNFSIYSLVLISAFIVILEVPFNRFLQWMVYKVYHSRTSTRPTSPEEVVASIGLGEVDDDDTTDHRQRRESRSHQKNILDEFKIVQTKKSMILRGARLEKQQRSMDFLLPVEETMLVMAQAEHDKLRHINHKILKNSDDNISFDRLKYGHQASPTSNRAESRILKNIQRSRRIADDIKSEMELMPNSEDREKFLIRNFVIDLFQSPYQRELVNRYMLGDFESVKFTNMRAIMRLLCIIFIPIYLLIIAYLTYSYNLSIGSRASRTWLIVTLVSFLQDAFIQKPLRIFVRGIIINAVVSGEVRRALEILKVRSRIILMRSSGVLRDSNALIQHFNPACRAARMFPELPLSRLLISMNDFDVPFAPKAVIFRVPIQYFLAFILSVSFLPIEWQDGVVDVVVSLLLTIFTASLISYGNILGIILILLFIFLAIVSREGFIVGFDRYKKRRQARLANENMFYTVDKDDGNGKEDKGARGFGVEDLNDIDFEDPILRAPLKKPNNSAAGNNSVILHTDEIYNGQLGFESQNVDNDSRFESQNPMRSNRPPLPQMQQSMTLYDSGPSLTQGSRLSLQGPPIAASNSRLFGPAVSSRNKLQDPYPSTAALQPQLPLSLSNINDSDKFGGRKLSTSLAAESNNMGSKARRRRETRATQSQNETSDSNTDQINLGDPNSIHDSVSIQQEDRNWGNLNRLSQESYRISQPKDQPIADNAQNRKYGGRNRQRRDLIRATSPSREPGGGAAAPDVGLMRSMGAPSVSSNLMNVNTDAALPTIDFLNSHPGAMGDDVLLSSSFSNNFNGGAAMNEDQYSQPRNQGGPGSVLYGREESKSVASKYPLWQS